MNDCKQMYVDVIIYPYLRLYVDVAKVSLMASTKTHYCVSYSKLPVDNMSFYRHCSVPTSAKTNIRPWAYEML